MNCHQQGSTLLVLIEFWSLFAGLLISLNTFSKDSIIELKINSLPAGIKKIIEENSVESMSALAGSAMDNRDNKGRAFAENWGDEIYVLPPEELARWKKTTLSFGDSWVEKWKPMVCLDLKF